ncbi:MAG: hypothetical protein V8S74_08530 [Lachnospirales bacterium]
MRVKKIILLLLVVVLLFIAFENGKGVTAIKYEEIDTTRDYMICKVDTATESTYSVLYNNLNIKKIRNVNIKNWYEQLYKFNGYFNDYFSSFLNTYVIYGKFDYNEETHDILISDFTIRPIDEVKRTEYEENNKQKSPNYIYRYEYSWILYIFSDLMRNF